MYTNPLMQTDFYKVGHKPQYPEGTTKVYSNLTPRSDRLANIPQEYRQGMVFFGMQYVIEDYLGNQWDAFFEEPEFCITSYKDLVDRALGTDVDVSHWWDLANLGYLPLKIKALPEGTVVPIGVPCFTIENTHDDFAWLTNYVETALSSYLWPMCTSATTARYYQQLALQYAQKTCENVAHVPFQFHDFSYRGMPGTEAAERSGAGHLTSFLGTDTIPAIDFIDTFYEQENEDTLIGASVPATEHSVMCMGGQLSEFETYERLLNLYPSGIVSIVSDTWDYWQVLTDYLPRLKDRIMTRDGKVVIRPDSGNPVDIICGTDREYSDDGSPEEKGSIQLLWELFGGQVNAKGYKVLDEHIGLIYGDSITPTRAKEIFERLEKKGFASSNVVLGIGSFTYQYVTRDTWGTAMKATYGEINGQPVSVQKDPKTDSGTKKSLKGLLRVDRSVEGVISVRDDVTREEEQSPHNLLKPVYENGKTDPNSYVSIEQIRLTITKGL